jgi:Flp pilus assembly protein TadD
MNAVKTLALAVCFPALVTGCKSGDERGLPPVSASERRGAMLLDEGRVPEARAVFLQTVQQNPQPFLSTIGLARCAIAVGNLSEGVAALHQAYAYAPKTPEAHELLGRTHLEFAKIATGGIRRQHASTAASLFSSAFRLAPELPDLNYHLGMSELLAGNPMMAVAFLEPATLEPGRSMDAVHALVLAYRQMGRRDDVRRLLEPLEAEGGMSLSLKRELDWAQKKTEPQAGNTTDGDHRNPGSEDRGGNGDGR